jgi:hypothetical protein
VNPVSERCGIVTFFSSQHAVQAEAVLKRAGLAVELIPGPKDISPNCGVALKCDLGDLAAVETLLSEGGVRYEAGHSYLLTASKSLLDKLLGR